MQWKWFWRDARNFSEIRRVDANPGGRRRVRTGAASEKFPGRTNNHGQHRETHSGVEENDRAPVQVITLQIQLEIFFCKSETTRALYCFLSANLSATFAMCPHFVTDAIFRNQNFLIRAVSQLPDRWHSQPNNAQRTNDQCKTRWFRRHRSDNLGTSEKELTQICWKWSLTTASSHLS